MNNFHDDDDDEYNETYVTCDPFSKLKYDDLRKVHKDQPIIGVSESDFHKIKQYNSTDEYARSRNRQQYTLMEQSEAEKMIIEKERIYKERMTNKMHKTHMKTTEYAQKNQNVLSTFLQLGN